MTKIFLSLTLAFALLAGCGAPSPKLAGNLSMTVKNYQQAADYYEKALKDDPDSVMLLTNLGRAYYNLGEYDKAETNFKGATQVQNGYPTADFYLGLCAIAKGDRRTGFDIFDNFRYIGKAHVTKSVRSMSKQLTDNTDDSNDYLIQKMFQAWNDGLQAEHQAETGRN